MGKHDELHAAIDEIPLLFLRVARNLQTLIDRGNLIEAYAYTVGALDVALADGSNLNLVEALHKIRETLT